MIANPQDVQQQLHNQPAAIVHRLDDLYAQTWYREENRKFLPETTVSPFWTKHRAAADRSRRFAELREDTRVTKLFRQGWDGYYAAAPNLASIAAALEALSRLQNESQLQPYSVLPTADGGVAISFRGREQRRAMLEMFNDGKSAYTLYGQGHQTTSEDFDARTEFDALFQLLAEYL